MKPKILVLLSINVYKTTLLDYKTGMKPKIGSHCQGIDTLDIILYRHYIDILLVLRQRDTNFKFILVLLAKHSLSLYSETQF